MNEQSTWECANAELRLGNGTPVIELEPAEWDPEKEICLEQVTVSTLDADRHIICGRRVRGVYFDRPETDGEILAQLAPEYVREVPTYSLRRPFSIGRMRCAAGACELAERLPVRIEIYGPLALIAPTPGPAEPVGNAGGGKVAARLRRVK